MEMLDQDMIAQKITLSKQTFIMKERAASESSSKRKSFDRISNCQEFWNFEMRGYRPKWPK